MLDHRMHTFLMLCETMNYTQAAQRLHVTQPAVTQHIRALEAYYGCKLFQYDGKKLTKTSEGALLEQAGHAMRYRESRTIEQLRAKPGQHLSLGATKTIGEFVIPGQISRFLADPDHTIRVEVDNTEKILGLLDKGELDLALIEGFFSRTRYDSQLYRREPFVGLCSTDHPFAGKTVSLDMLLQETLLLREEGSGTRKILEDLLGEVNHTVADFRRVMTVSNFGLISRLAEAGNGITFAYAAVGEQNPRLTTFRVESWDTYREFNYVYLRDAGAERLVELFEKYR